LTSAPVASLTKAEYKAEKTLISTTYKADKAACASFSDNAKDICVLEAKGTEKVAPAELEYSYTGKAADQTRVLEAQAKNSCVAVAKAQFGKS
jgi:hypothetical protein